MSKAFIECTFVVCNAKNQKTKLLIKIVKLTSAKDIITSSTFNL